MLLGISALGVFVHADGNVELHHLVEVVDGMLYVLWNGTMGEGLEVEQTGVAPPFSIAGLDAELALNLIKTLRIDVRLHSIPDGEEMTGLMDTFVVFVAQFIPEGATALHAEVPRHVVEPGQQILRTGIDVVVEAAEFIGILLDISRTIHRAVETHTDAVGFVVVGWSPVCSDAFRTVPGLRAIVVGAGKDMMDTQRHHVVDASLAAVEHKLEKR